MVIHYLCPNPILRPLIKRLSFFFILFIFISDELHAQQNIPIPNPADTSRVIEIVQGRSMRQIKVDSVTTLETLAGDAIVKQGKTRLSSDSIVINQRTGIAEAFGKVHINDADTVNTYSDYLKYIGKDRIAYLKKNVKLTDHKGILFTDDLVYNLSTGIATYKGGGKVQNVNTTLTSEEGVYYSDTKDVYFKKNVHLVDPKYDIRTDSLIYNTKNEIATFISPTHIISKNGVIDTRSGTYNLKTGEAIFFDRTAFRDSTHSLIGDKVAYDEKSGVIQVDGHGKLVDSANKVIVLGGLIFLNRNTNSFLATKKPVMILYRDKDSTYIAADTLFSGQRQYDALKKKKKDKQDTLKNAVNINLNNNDTTVRYFLAFHHVRIFNDSLQSVSDSLYYSTEDSTFQLFGQPVVWNENTQVSGDTIFLFTENQKAKRLYVFYNGIIINKANSEMYNQISGRTLNGYFINGEIDYFRARGSQAESIFYPQDDDSAYTGMNHSQGDVIDIYFASKEVKKIKFVRDVKGTMYPLNQIPADQKYLRNFKWEDARRPKSKFELFE